ncbi:MAG: hypothetical protein Q8P05_03690 [Candidatus Diapherotrites archaeon]|nr:hypothetical protein [Candidatus Diapherotrites archaeon]MDZ4256912.1 hypothetical protein [archaeon]
MSITLDLAIPLLLQTNLFGDLELVLKIVGLLFIVSFVRNHVPHPLLALGLIIGLSVFLLFDFWRLFGSGVFLYILVLFGATGLFIDLGFLGGFSKPMQGMEKHAKGLGKSMQAKPGGGGKPVSTAYQMMRQPRGR